MKLISLFTGVGGFDLGFEDAGFTTVGQCEIDPHAMRVLNHHWPDVPKHDDIATLDGMAFGPAEVVTFGSPCQDLSVAGGRAGLDGERSGLFTEAMRFIREMQAGTDGQYPQVVLWENVPGAYSSNGGKDFAAVLESMVGGAVESPEGRWGNAGVAFGPKGTAEWRTLDSQHFGVAQRRRRVFVVYRPGARTAGEVLLEPRGVRRDTEPSGAARTSDAGSPPGGPGAHGESGLARTITTKEGTRYDPEVETLLPEVMPTVCAAHGGKDASPAGLLPLAFTVRAGMGDGGKGYLGSEDKAPALTATGRSQWLADPIAFRQKSSAEAGLSLGNLSPTLEATEPQHAVSQGYRVRRLTPLEVERLQGFPDNFTAVGGMADSHRYRFMGNAVTVPVARWIAERIRNYL